MFGSLPVANHATTFIWWPAVASHDFMVIDITPPASANRLSANLPNSKKAEGKAKSDLSSKELVRKTGGIATYT
jgi:hypothetical protein